MIVYALKDIKNNLYWDRIFRSFKPLNQHTAFYKSKNYSPYHPKNAYYKLVKIEIREKQEDEFKEELGNDIGLYGYGVSLTD